MDYARIKDQLLEKRNELLSRVNKLDKDIHHRDEPYEKDFAEQAVELENLEVLFELDREGRELDHIAGTRYFCNQCHVPQADAPALVENVFKPSNEN